MESSWEVVDASSMSLAHIVSDDSSLASRAFSLSICRDLLLFLDLKMWSCSETATRASLWNMFCYCLWLGFDVLFLGSASDGTVFYAAKTNDKMLCKYWSVNRLRLYCLLLHSSFVCNNAYVTLRFDRYLVAIYNQFLVKGPSIKYVTLE